MEQTSEIIKMKRECELGYWHSTIEKSGFKLNNSHYEYFYTTFFGYHKSFFDNKKILDIGCGPRGSLEWADNSKERIGLDPLADSYRALGSDRHSMTYVNSGSENIPYATNYFDIVCSFNSLDHVDNLDATICEIKRVLNIGGHFFLITDVNHDPTPTEPISLEWNVVELFAPEFIVYSLQHYEKGANGIYNSIQHEREPYNHQKQIRRYGILCAAFKNCG